MLLLGASFRNPSGTDPQFHWRHGKHSVCLMTLTFFLYDDTNPEENVRHCACTSSEWSVIICNEVGIFNCHHQWRKHSCRHWKSWSLLRPCGHPETLQPNLTYYTRDENYLEIYYRLIRWERNNTLLLKCVLYVIGLCNMKKKKKRINTRGEKKHVLHCLVWKGCSSLCDQQGRCSTRAETFLVTVINQRDYSYLHRWCCHNLSRKYGSAGSWH